MLLLSKTAFLRNHLHRLRRPRISDKFSILRCLYKGEAKQATNCRAYTQPPSPVTPSKILFWRTPLTNPPSPPASHTEPPPPRRYPSPFHQLPASCENNPPGQNWALRARRASASKQRKWRRHSSLPANFPFTIPWKTRLQKNALATLGSTITGHWSCVLPLKKKKQTLLYPKKHSD